MNKYIKFLMENLEYPYTEANYKINDYVRINLFWLYYIKKYTHDDENWNYFDYQYENFDSYPEQSISVIYIENKFEKKSLIINPIDKYSQEFLDREFYIGVDIVNRNDNDIHEESYLLEFSVNLMKEKAIIHANYFLDLFLVKKIEIDEMKIEIEQFESTHSLTNG
ncbi:hypothetical protein G9F31_09340 [Acinetobacter sp. 187]|uniref:hypothetical protein n=1 Tax=Acinetobacter lanii TaxID=2715163 RepID=UPI001408A01E|nr:hypothetical protein [Acinetobacter lanii]NHC03972.1 hypothetical protein [Acinetobacter lanii]